MKVRYDVAVVGAGVAGLVTATPAGQGGQARRAGGGPPLPRRPGDAPPLSGTRDRAGLPPRRGSRRQPDQGAASTSACRGAQRAQRLDAVLGQDRLEADPGVLRRARRSRASSAASRRSRELRVRGLRVLGPRVAAGVDVPVHERRGSVPGLGGDLGARADHVPLVGALRLREPLHAKAPLRQEAHRGLLVLADRRLGEAVERDGATCSRSIGGTLRLSALVEECWSRTAGHGLRLRNRRTVDSPGEILDADQVVVNAPVWDLPRAVCRRRPALGPAERIRMLANNRNRRAGSDTGSPPRSPSSR